MFESNIPNYTLNRGKVRDLYEYGQSLYIIVTTDRISAFDWVFPKTEIPDKGKILTKMSEHWSKVLDTYYHLVSTDTSRLPSDFHLDELKDRTMLVQRGEVIPFECVVRGYLCGSAWKEYKKFGTVGGKESPQGLKQNQQFPRPMFTPSTKAKEGHDKDVIIEDMMETLGELALELEARSIELYTEAAEYAWNKGVILADTKFEWALLDGELMLIDEIITPDSSRFWMLEDYKMGRTIKAYDKQFIRDWVQDTGWDKESPPPYMPNDIVQEARNRYLEIYRKIVGEPSWK